MDHHKSGSESAGDFVLMLGAVGLSHTFEKIFVRGKK